MRTDFDKNTTSQDYILYFSASWCAPCKFLRPIMEELDAEHADLDIFYVDLDENQDIARDERIMSVPTVKFFVGGKETEALTGLRQKSDYDALITEHYYEV